MKRVPIIIGVVLSVGTVACGPDVVLLSDDGRVRLEYDCADWERQVYASYEEEVLLSHSRRILEAADRAGDAETVTRFFLAEEHSTIGLLEERVVEHACEFGLPGGSESSDPIFPQVGSVARDFALPLLLAEPPFAGDLVRLSDHLGQVPYGRPPLEVPPPECGETHPVRSESAGNLT
jgi:hypothetical protein